MYCLVAVFMCPLLNLEVESWIVYPYHHVGLPLRNVVLAESYVAQYRSQVG